MGALFRQLDTDVGSDADVLAPGCDVSIGDSNVVDGADVNPPSADAGPDPCVSNHDVLPLVPVVPDVPVSTEAMMPRTARRGIVEIPLCGLNHWSWIRSIYVLPAIEGEHEAKYGISPVFIHQHTGHHAAHSTPVTTPVTFTSTPVTTPVTFSAW
eukprot:Em0014g496a